MLMKQAGRHQHGLGMVELMVGITVGLIVAAGASLVAVNQISEHRRLMLETQVQQDLRTAADLLQQEMRRAGFRGQADLGVWAPAKAVGSGPSTAIANLYAPLTVTTDKDTGNVVVSYLYARQDPVTFIYSPTGTPSGNEQFGFMWDKQTEVLYLKLGLGANGQPNWQPITDPDNLRIKNFSVNLSDQFVNLGEFCDQPCDPTTTTASDSCPRQNVREVSFQIVGQAKHDANVVRTLTGTERIRTEAIIGACPP